MQEIWVQSLGQEHPLEKEIATHSSILAWKIPCTEEAGRLQSLGSQSWTPLSTHAYMSYFCLDKCITSSLMVFDVI